MLRFMLPVLVSTHHGAVQTVEASGKPLSRVVWAKHKSGALRCSLDIPPGK